MAIRLHLLVIILHEDEEKVHNQLKLQKKIFTLTKKNKKQKCTQFKDWWP